MAHEAAKHENREALETPADALPQVSRRPVVRAAPVDVSGDLGPIPHGAESYRLLGKIGEGGMAVVYRAEQAYPRRLVALKVLKISFGDTSALKRFEREVAILAQLGHRGIAQLYSAGTLDTSDPTENPSTYLAMELVDGLPVTTYACSLCVANRIALFMKLCDAVAYAHAMGVVHRDLKPSNVLVNGEGEPKVLDFGLATMRNTRAENNAPLTQHGQLLGTLDYMSPEQAASPESADAQSDVYSLGVLLYELLAGHRPFNFGSADLATVVRKIQSADPVRLSAGDPSLRGDLETIVHKALAKDKSERYRTVAEVRDDLRRFLEDQPIRARPTNMGYRFRKTLRRQRNFIASAIIVLTVLVLSAITLSHQIQSTRDSRRNAELHDTQRILAQAEADMSRGRYIIAREGFTNAWNGLDRLGVSSFPAQLGVWQLDQVAARPIRTLDVEGDYIDDIAFSPDRRLIALGLRSDDIQVRDLMTNAVLVTFHGQPSRRTLQFSSRGDRLLVGYAQRLEVWDISKRVRIATRGMLPHVYGPRMSGDAIAYAERDGPLRVESLDGTLLQRLDLDGRAVTALEATARGVVFVDDAGGVWLLEPQAPSASRLATLPPRRTASGVRLSPDGRHVAFVRDRQLVVTSLDDTSNAFSAEHFNEGGKVDFLDESTVAAVNDTHDTLMVFDLTGRVRMRLPLGANDDTRMGPGMAAAQMSGASGWGLWTLVPSTGAQTIERGKLSDWGGALSGDGAVVALAKDKGNVTLTEVATGRERASFGAGTGARQMAFDAAGKRLALATDNEVMCYDLDTGLRTFLSPAPVLQSFAFSKSGNVIAISRYEGGPVEIWHRRSAQEWAPGSLSVGESASTIDLSADGSTCVVVGVNVAELWRVLPTPERLWRLAVPPTQFERRAVFAENGQTIAVTESPELIAMWEVKSRTRRGAFPPLAEQILDVAACDNATIAVLTAHGVHLFNAHDCTLLRTFDLPVQGARRVRLSADGMRLLCWSRVGGAVLWDLSVPGRLRSRPEDLSALGQFEWFHVAGIGPKQ